MQAHPYWPSWLKVMKKWGIVEPAIILLDACSPLAVVLAQVAYFSQPFITSQGGGDQLRALGGLLENPQDKLSFLELLHEEKG